MRKYFLIALLLIAGKLNANPVLMPPIISEFYYNDGDWKIELYFGSDWEGLINDFSELAFRVDSVYAPFVDGLSFQYDSVIVIDQTCLTETLFIDPEEEWIYLYHYWYGNVDILWYGSYVITGNYQVLGPTEGQSIVKNRFTGNGDDFYIPMLDNEPSIGTNPFVCSSRATFNGYVIDQFNNPVSGLKLSYCQDSYCYGAVSPIFSCIETDENGYFESHEMFPMWHHFKLEKDGFIFTYDTLFFQPDSALYKEYVLTNVGIRENFSLNKIDILVAPNPFSDKTSFHISMPDYQRWEYGKITIRNINGQVLDEIPFPNAEWSGNTFSITWYPSMAKADVWPGLYLYSLEIDGEFVASEKIVITK